MPEALDYLVPPDDIRIEYPLDTSYATVVFSRQLSAIQWLSVYDFAGNLLDSTYSQAPDNQVSFLTPTAGLYRLLVTDIDGGTEEQFYVPIIGQLFACSNRLLEHALPCGKCPAELNRDLRAVDVLARGIWCLACQGDYVNAQALLELALPLCETCNCGCHGL